MAKIKYHSAETLKQLKILVDEFVELKKNISDIGNTSTEAFSKIEKKLFSLQMLSGKTKKAINNLADSIERQTKEQNKNSKAIDYQLKLVNVYNKQIAENTRRNKSNTISIKNKTNALSGLFKTFGAFVGLNYLKQLGATIFEMAKNFDSLRYSMQTVSDTAFDLASSQRFLLKISEDYGVELLATSQRYIKFLAAAKQSNLSLYDTEKIFGSVTKAASVLGLKTDELTGVYLALEQMLSKGKVTTEELRRQLGERLPGAMGIMAAALDVTIPKLDEMLKKGEVMSADALPKFAEAVELAYGIQSVKKVDNLVAAQNRLSNTWQILIQDITKGDGAFGKFIKNVLNGINDIIKKLGLIGGSEDLKFQNAIIAAEKEFEPVFEKQVKDRLKREGIIIKNVTNEIYETRGKILTSKNKKEKAEYEKHLRDLVSLQISQNKLVEKTKKEIASEEISLAVSNHKALTKMYENDKKALDVVLKEKEDAWNTYNKTNWEENKKLYGERGAIRKVLEAEKKYFKTNWEERTKELKSNLQQSASDLAWWTARFDKYRKLLQESDVQTLPVKPTKVRIDTSDLDLMIEKLKNAIKNINHFIDLPSTGIKQKLESLKVLFDLESKLIKTQRDKEIKLANKHKTKEEIASVKHQQKLFEIDWKWNERKTKLEQDFFKKGLDEIARKTDNEANIELVALRKKFQKIKKATKAQVKQYKEDEAEIRRKYNNKQMMEQVEFLRQWLDILKISGDERVKFEQKIQELLAKIRANTKFKEETKITLQEELAIYRDFINEIGNLVDSLLERRLEAIDAEINAEEKKYDKLLRLAENDELEKAALEKQKEDRIALLEKKRLKEEQRQAKIRKAFAISEIAINTAISVSKIWGQTGIFGIKLQYLALAMGALQTAAVLAQPIPQYKDGIDSVPEDQIAMINDGGKKEYVERNGKILTTDTKNAIVNLKKNDIVHKDYDSMIKNSKSGLIISGGEILKQSQFDKLSNTIESSIDKGFKNIKINNNNTIKTKLSNNYLKEKSRFNG